AVVAVGKIQASNVAAFVRSSEFASLTRSRSLLPSNSSAPPFLPVVQVGPLVSVPVLLFPDWSEATSPEPSSMAYAATGPATWAEVTREDAAANTATQKTATRYLLCMKEGPRDRLT